MDNKYIHSSLQPKPTWASQSHKLALQMQQTSSKRPPFEQLEIKCEIYTAISHANITDMIKPVTTASYKDYRNTCELSRHYTLWKTHVHTACKTLHTYTAHNRKTPLHFPHTDITRHHCVDEMCQRTSKQFYKAVSNAAYIEEVPL
mgnify:CR=1 FL=1|jgi:hypothetical protein